MNIGRGIGKALKAFVLVAFIIGALIGSAIVLTIKLLT